MKLLTDEDIVQLLQADSPIMKNFKKPHDWFAAASMVQPSSLDLHVGSIIVPPSDEPKPNDILDYRDEYLLEPGQTAVVVTQEELHLPKDIAGFGFPPTSISDRAILMTNPGHVDPGFEGPLNFTLINMGREPYRIVPGTRIVTLLLVKLAKPAKADFRERYPDFKPAHFSPWKLYSLGRDFLDLDNRSRSAARKVIQGEDLRIRYMQVWIPILAALISAIVAFGASWIQSSQAIETLNQRVVQLEFQLNSNARLDELENRVDALYNSTTLTNTETITNTNQGP